MRFINIKSLAAIFVALAVLPFPAYSQTGTLFVESNKVGIGVPTPLQPLHVQVPDTSGFPRLLLLESAATDFVGFRFSSTGGSIDFNKAGGNQFRLNIVDGDTWEFNLDQDGDLTIKGDIFTAGTCSGGCDRVFSPDYALPSIEEHADAMWSNSFLPMVGPTPEGQQINLTQKTEGILNELEKAHIYIDQLNSSLKDKTGQIADLEARLSSIEGTLQLHN